MTSTGIKPARKKRLGDILYGEILEQILAGNFKEGDKLPTEIRLTEMFDVSRPVVRQALNRLSADGIVISRQGDGTYVQKRPSSEIYDFANIDDLPRYWKSFEVRLALEPEAARLAAKRRSDEDLVLLKSDLIAFETSISIPNASTNPDYAFHRRIAQCSGNELFVTLLDTCHEIITGSMTVALGLTQRGSDERKRVVIQEHKHVFEAIEQKDEQAAESYMRHHLMQSKRRATGGQSSF